MLVSLSQQLVPFKNCRLFLKAMSATCSSTAQTGQSADASSDSVHGFNSQDWYQEKIESIPDNERELLEQYSGLKPDEVTPHVVAVVS